MKKIMIALATVAMAAVVQAASVTWNSGVIYDSTGTKATASSKDNYVTCALYILTEAQYKAAGDTSKSMFDWYTANKGDLTQYTTTTKGSNGTGKANIQETNAGWAASSTLYSMIVYEDAAGKMIANTYAIAIDSTGLGGVENAALKIHATGAATEWQSVPEPTSAMLLLLGVAGLALKRKRA